MEAQGKAEVWNARVISSVGSGVVEREMELAGVHCEGVRIMGAGAEFAAVRLDGVPFALARRVKEVMLAAGSDAALTEAVWRGSQEPTPVILAATRRQYKELFKAFGGDGGEAQAFADAVAKALDNYNRTDFCIKAGGARLRLGQGSPAIMGILNVTPDSFSDGGKFFDTKEAVAQGLRMAREGAAIIDVGAESTRPGSMGVSAGEEVSRAIPVIEALSKEAGVPVSIDTTKAKVAEAAFEAGATILNDVTALAESDMRRFAAERGCPVVLMHMKGTPRTMQKSPYYTDLMGEVALFLREAVERAVDAGVDREQTVVDPGIGFGKSVSHNLEIQQRLKVLASLGRPIMVGSSRKSFIGKITGEDVEGRSFGTAASVALAAARGAHILRVHDVKEMKQACDVAWHISRGRWDEEGG